MSLRSLKLVLSESTRFGGLGVPVRVLMLMRSASKRAGV